jgi:hypothetical protein
MVIERWESNVVLCVASFCLQLPYGLAVIKTHFMVFKHRCFTVVGSGYKV